MHLQRPLAIIFDCDGVLVDSEIIHVAAELELLSQLGLTYDRETYLTRFVGLSHSDFHAQVMADYSIEVGDKFPTNFGSQLDQIVWPRIEAELQAIEGVADLVQAFGGKVAVGSSSPYPKLVRKLEITGLKSLFAPHIYSSDHVRVGKPAPDLFLHSAAQLAVDPSRCFVIEDSVHGISAAKAAGMTPIGFVGGSHGDSGLEERLFKSGAAIVVSHHSQIQALMS